MQYAVCSMQGNDEDTKPILQAPVYRLLSLTPMKFIADAMVGKLAKRMRLLGFDVLYGNTLEDNSILCIALEQDRIILTRDTGLASRPLARNHILIQSDMVDEQLAQVLDLFTIHEKDALTRCTICNEQLSEMDRHEARNSVPDHVYENSTGFRQCISCRRVYWKGSHLKNMAKMRLIR